MRAAVLVAPRILELRELPDPAPGPHDVIVGPSAVGVCGTDFHVFSGQSNWNFDPSGQPVPLSVHPQVLGHEITGVVLERGRDVRDLQVGDRVVLDQGLNCRSRGHATLCEYCQTGDTHQCEHYAEHGLSGPQGAFAEMLAMPAVNAIRIESDVDTAEAAVSEPLGCVLHTLDQTQRAHARYRLGDRERPVRTVMICGAGPAGLLFLQALRNVAGFDGEVLVTEPDPTRRALAARLGATVLDPSAEDVTEGVLAHTRGRRVELLIEATGSGHIFAHIPAWIRKQATVLMYGTGHGDARLDLMNQMQWKEPTLVLAVGASGGFEADGRPTTFRRSLQLIEDSQVLVRPLLTHRYEGIERVPAAFAGDHEQPGYVKGIALLD